jgi:hypothetical protein
MKRQTGLVLRFGAIHSVGTIYMKISFRIFVVYCRVLVTCMGTQLSNIILLLVVKKDVAVIVNTVAMVQTWLLRFHIGCVWLGVQLLAWFPGAKMDLFG